jgi:hypothetical protein
VNFECLAEAPVQADYTKQLIDIIAALRQPSPWWTNSWILASFSAFLGVLGGFVGQLILRRYADWQTRKTLLKLGYRYTGELLAVLDTLVSAPEPLREHQQTALRIVLPTMPEEYVKAHLEIYTALPEAASFDVIFNVSKRLNESGETYDLINGALEMIVFQFAKECLTLKSVAKYQNKEETATFAEMLARHEPTVQKRYPSG